MPAEWAEFYNEASEYDEMFKSQTEAQQNCMDYKMFKKLKSIKQSDQEKIDKDSFENLL